MDSNTRLIQACKNGREALADIINAADNGHPYTPAELTSFLGIIDEIDNSIIKASKFPAMYELLKAALELRKIEEQQGDVVNWPKWFEEAQQVIDSI